MTASRNPSEQHADRDRRRERDLVADGARGDLAETEEPVAATRARARGQRRAERADRSRHDDAEDDADEAAEDALGERLAHHLAHDEPLRPAERLERPELAHALPDRRERQEDREQERGDRGEHGERRSESLREARGVDERPADRVGDLLRARDLRPRVERLDLLLHVADRRSVLGANEEDVDGALLAREHLQLRQRDVDVRGLAAERRPHEADDGERGAVEVELRADLQALPARVGAREQRLVGSRALARGDEPAARDERCGDDADVGRRRIDARDRVAWSS